MMKCLTSTLLQRQQLSSRILRSLSAGVDADSFDACDCHVHIVDSSLHRFPQISNRLYTAAPASLNTLQSFASPLGIRRFVLVQPSFYGTDNRCLLQALDQLGSNNGRGVVVIDPTTTTLSQLEHLHRKGIRGVRINLHSRLQGSPEHENGKIDKQILHLIKQMKNWYLQIFASMATIIRMRETIEQLAPLRIVLDHYGMPDEDPSSSQGRLFLDLISKQSHIWIKLSAPYRLSKMNPMESRPPQHWLNAILEKIPDRCVWASDWPHTPDVSVAVENNKQPVILPYRAQSYRQLFKNFTNSIDDPALVRKILVTNPQILNDF